MEIKKTASSQFTPISIDDFIASTKKNGNKMDYIQLKKDLIRCRELRNKGVKCECGDELWVIGSAIVHLGCYTCITMEASPSDDYDIE